MAESDYSDSTSGGVPFIWLIDGYDSQGAPDANMEVMQVRVKWDDASAFLRDAVGYTTWNGVSGAPLSRVLPMECPLRPGLYCERYKLLRTGVYADTEDVYDPFTYCFKQDWCRYQLTFTRPKHRVISDGTLASTYQNREQNRYCTYARSYEPRERRYSGPVFQYLKAGGDPANNSHWQTIPDESAFIADHRILFSVVWRQVPTAAVPEAALADLLMTTNADPFVFSAIGGIQAWPKGSLLFKGPMQDIEPYQGADGGWYEDLALSFVYIPGGPNAWLRPDLVGGQRDYGPIRRRKPDGTGGSLPYGQADFNLLFQTGNYNL